MISIILLTCFPNSELHIVLYDKPLKVLLAHLPCIMITFTCEDLVRVSHTSQVFLYPPFSSLPHLSL